MSPQTGQWRHSAGGSKESQMPQKLQGLRKRGFFKHSRFLWPSSSDACNTTISKTRKFYIPANYFTGSLAMTDPLVSISGMFISITHTTAHTWSCVTSGHLLTSHAAKPPSWYWAITDTLENSKHQTVGHVAAMLAIIWAIFIHISIPSLLWQQIKAHEEISACLVNTSLISYIIHSICGALYIPPVLLIILYGQIYTNTWNHPDSIITLWEVLPTSHQRLRGPCSARSKPAFMRGTLI